MPRKSKKQLLKDNEQINGELDTDNEKFVPTTLAQLFGEDDGLNKYKTLDKEEYKQSLGEMNTADLRGHASKLGIMPLANRERLTKRLQLEHSRHVAGHQKPASSHPVQPSNISKQVRDILAEAK